jgi:hypothetical protein
VDRLGGGLGQGADSAGRKSELHPTDTFGLEIDRKCPARVALGMADFVTGLGSPAGKLADATHKKGFKSCLDANRAYHGRLISARGKKSLVYGILVKVVTRATASHFTLKQTP